MRRDDRLPQLMAAALLAGMAFVVSLELLWRERPAAVGGNQFGYTPDPEGVAAFMASLPQPMFRQAGADAMAKSKGLDTFLFRAMQKAHRARYGSDFVVGKQLNGSCVAWGAMHAVFCAEAVSWELGELQDPPTLPATEPLYGTLKGMTVPRPLADGPTARSGQRPPAGSATGA